MTSEIKIDEFDDQVVVTGVTLDGLPVAGVLIEKSVCPPRTNPKALADWAKHEAEATIRRREFGEQRHGSLIPGLGWRWYVRVWHDRENSVSIRLAQGNS